MDTIPADGISAVIIDHEPVEFVVAGLDQPIPLVVGFNPDGSFQTAADLAHCLLVRPLHCDHAGATWSSCLDMRCPRCGAAMFLPPRLLAHLPGEIISAMHLLWAAAGWPEWHGDQWSISDEHWTLQSHPDFDYLGGLPVRDDRQWNVAEALYTLAEDGGDE